MIGCEKAKKIQDSRETLLKFVNSILKSLEEEINLFLETDVNKRINSIIKIKELLKESSRCIDIISKDVSHFDEDDRKVLLKILDRFSEINHLFIKGNEKG